MFCHTTDIPKIFAVITVFWLFKVILRTLFSRQTFKRRPSFTQQEPKWFWRFKVENKKRWKRVQFSIFYFRNKYSSCLWEKPRHRYLSLRWQFACIRQNKENRTHLVLPCALQAMKFSAPTAFLSSQCPSKHKVSYSNRSYSFAEKLLC